jgi:hypothetical protein
MDREKAVHFLKVIQDLSKNDLSALTMEAHLSFIQKVIEEKKALPENLKKNIYQLLI